MQNPGNSRAHILIIDDEPGVRDILQKMLCVSHECRAVSSAEEALSLLSTDEFDLILSDIRMSGMSGLQMIPPALKSAPDTVLRVTAEGIETEEQLGLLRLLRCDVGQGYLFGRPMSADGFRSSLIG